MNRRGHPWCAVAIIIVMATGASAEEFNSPTYGFYTDVPTGWVYTGGNGHDRFSLGDPQGKGTYQIAVYSQKGSPWTDSHSFATEIAKRLSSKGQIERFSYEGRDTAFMSLDFSPTGTRSRGFALFIRGLALKAVTSGAVGSTGSADPSGGAPAGKSSGSEGASGATDADVALIAFCDATDYDSTAAFLVSALDGFSADAGCRLKPGPISQYDEQAVAPAAARNSSLSFLGGSIDIPVSPVALDSEQSQVEREFKVLAAYKDAPDWKEAWQRYYRLIYRDGYARLDRLALLIGREFDRRGVQRDGIPAALLPWIQDFEYIRSLNTADFVAPLDAAIERKGDCDSRALLYVILLHHFNIDAVLLVSAEYSHAMAGVDIPGAGARFPFQEKKYLVAETTAKVGIGLIGGNVADPSKWIGIDFPAF
jgi:hypothetical protein